jgi:S1-C subfamily serine protease
MKCKNQEEAPIYRQYSDPEHDFAILRYDPGAVKRMQLKGLELRPELAKVGVDIEIVGNDAGETLSIHRSTISVVDKNPPEYGNDYNDSNTTYMQSSAGTVCGSSGSPVVNIKGYALGLQIAGKDGAMSNFIFPLDRPRRALHCIQNGEPVTRGTIQCTWLIKSFDQCQTLGMTPQQQNEVLQKFPKETGMLVATIIVPNGPSAGKIKEGDILIKVEEEIVTKPIPLDEIFDLNVNKKIRLVLQRGPNTVNVVVSVEDLHKITPDRFLCASGAIFHNVSLPQAQRYRIPCRGVFVSQGNPCWPMRVEGGYILETLDHKKATDLHKVIEIWKLIPDESRVVATYRDVHDLQTLRNVILDVGPRWARVNKIDRRD